MQPRIYTYRITFEEVPYYYYGVKKERYFDEEYWGSPYTNKWCWELYTAKKQILEVFEYSDSGWLEANKVEKRLISQFYNSDKWCLNESVAGNISLKTRRKIGKKLHKEKVGIHGFSQEERVENARNAGKIGGHVTHQKSIGLFSLSKEERIDLGKKTYAEGKGLASISPEKRKENSKKFGRLGGEISGKQHKENKTGIFSIKSEQHSENSKKGGAKTKELGVGIFAIPPEKVQERNKKNALQRWKCLETEFITNAGNLTKYQKARGIDTSKRIRIS
jgi:hypothetical protein